MDTPLDVRLPCRAPEAKPRVWVVDDDASVRVALSRLLRSTALDVETFASGGEVLDRLAQKRPRCLVLDLALPGVSGLDLLHLLHARGEAIPVVFVTGEGDVSSSVKAMKDGAVDFLEKPVDADALLRAVIQALAREAEWRVSRQRADHARELIGTLTPRERQVLHQVTRGRTNKEIATHLGTSEKTVKVHRGRVMHKLCARSVVDLVHLTEHATGLAPE